ncbi:MAG TPA: TetR/AcrR family transcriptional regulator [Acidimicrobiales bacterium]|jgi:AcrR family transcriptional regulator|nr:TetR/AcrR family transcriptional regulator [Acidimicrobiales bacterium]
MTTRQRQLGGRPRSFETDQAVDAALELFWLQGYRQTSTRDLEARLGIGQSSIYNAFGSKLRLLEAALDRYERQISDALVTPLERSLDGIAAIDDFFAALAAWITTDGRRGCMILNLMAESADEPEIGERTRTYRRRLREAFHAALQREPGVDPASAEVRAELLMTAVLGLNIAAREGAGPDELRHSVGAVRHLLDDWTPGQRRPPA